MAAKLNAMRLLESHKIPYEALAFPDTIHDAGEVAETLGVPPELVYKTLVVQSAAAGDKPALALVASTRQLDLKKLAAAWGVKKAGMAAHREAERLTGLKVGGISALALTHKRWTVFIDQPATAHEHIIVSAGQRGVNLRVPTTALIQVTGARVAEISAEA